MFFKLTVQSRCILSGPPCIKEGCRPRPKGYTLKLITGTHTYTGKCFIHSMKKNEL